MKTETHEIDALDVTALIKKLENRNTYISSAITKLSVSRRELEDRKSELDTEAQLNLDTLKLLRQRGGE
jgi:hypothetical protein